jgi:hypothetical protein
METIYSSSRPSIPIFHSAVIMIKATLVTTLITFTLGFGTAKAQTYTKQQLQEIYSSHLANEGFRPKIDNDGDISFRSEGRTFWIQIYENDPTFFSMFMGFIQEDKSPQMRLRRLEGCNIANQKIKVIKCHLDKDGDPIFGAEMFLANPGDFKTNLSHLLRAIEGSYKEYRSQYSQ